MAIQTGHKLLLRVHPAIHMDCQLLFCSLEIAFAACRAFVKLTNMVLIIVLIFCYAHKRWRIDASLQKHLSWRVTEFASIAFGYPNAFRLGSTQTPANQPDTYNQGKEPYM